MATSQDPTPIPSDDSADRIRAYLASVRPLREVQFSDNEALHRGRALIERLAMSAPGANMPTMRLSPLECADVLNFIHSTEPLEPRDWWRDPDDAPSHVVGFALILQALECSLRAEGAVKPGAAPNVTPIRRGSDESSPEPLGSPSKCWRFHLNEPDDEPGSLRVIQGLHGVCYAIDHLADDSDNAAEVLELGTAAEILSDMLRNRVDCT